MVSEQESKGQTQVKPIDENYPELFLLSFQYKPILTSLQFDLDRFIHSHWHKAISLWFCQC